jgi:methylmalonyl-CoA mutase C-terminal domain/subunit
MEVIYTGLKRTPDEIVAEAIQEDVDIIGLSILSGAHLTLARKVIDRLAAAGAGDVAVVVGGTVPHADAGELAAWGVRRVFPTGTPLAEIVDYFRGFGRGGEGEAGDSVRRGT